MEIKVSVVVPVYNSEKYLECCLESLIHQTWDNMEIIIIDNGSTDKSIDIIKNYLLKTSKLKFYTSTVTGASPTRNIGIDNATGDYLLFVDSDDYVHEEYVEKMTSLVHKNESTIVLCNNFELYKDRIDERLLFKDKNINALTKIDIISEISSGNAGLVCSKLADLKVIKSNNIKFKKELKVNEDQIFFLEVTKYIDKFEYLKESLYYYNRKNEKSITQSHVNNAWEGQLSVIDYMEKVLNEVELVDEERMILLANKVKLSLIYSISNELNTISCKNFIKRINKCKFILQEANKIIDLQHININSSLDVIFLRVISMKNYTIGALILFLVINIFLPIKMKFSRNFKIK